MSLSDWMKGLESGAYVVDSSLNAKNPLPLSEWPKELSQVWIDKGLCPVKS